MFTLDEKLDLHPRVAHHLNERGLLWINEYRYLPICGAPGGSMDFLAVDPKTGTFYIIECKLVANELSKIDNQLTKYFNALLLGGAQREVYAFHASLKQKAWLNERGIAVHTVTMETVPISLESPWQVWEDIETIHSYWHDPYMLPPVTYERNPHLDGARPYQVSDYKAGLARYYREHLESNDLSPYYAHVTPPSLEKFYGDAE